MSLTSSFLEGTLQRSASPCDAGGGVPGAGIALAEQVEARPGSASAGRLLGRYLDCSRHMREIVACKGPRGTVLVIDRFVLTGSDSRLVAHLGADEPRANAELVCARYLSDARRGRCRRVHPRDHVCDPYRVAAGPCVERSLSTRSGTLCERRGPAEFRLGLEPRDGVRDLRWLRFADRAASSQAPVSLREVIGATERYDPACQITSEALARRAGDDRVSVAVLRLELLRVRESPIVLNRGLREAVLDALELGGLSMSEIALRCGRVKRDSKGNASGETSWLARRLGLVAESGAARPTPWVHTDVLALIARSGLGLSPLEVELA